MITIQRRIGGIRIDVWLAIDDHEAIIVARANLGTDWRAGLGSGEGGDLLGGFAVGGREVSLSSRWYIG
jgi:hypothetical protein